MDVEDGAQAVLVEALEEADVAAVGDPGLRAVEKSGDNNSAMDTDFCFTFQTFVVPHTRLYRMPKELLAFASLLSISLSILASENTITCSLFEQFLLNLNSKKVLDRSVV